MKLPISSARLALRLAQENDSRDLHRLMSGPDWIRYIGDRGINSPQDARRYIQETLQPQYDSQGFGMYIAHQGAQFVGVAGFVQRDYLDAPDLGIAFLPEFHGQGLASECVQALISYGWEHLKLKKLLAITVPDNQRAKALVTRLGFEEAGSVLNPQGETLLKLQLLNPGQPTLAKPEGMD